VSLRQRLRTLASAAPAPSCGPGAAAGARARLSWPEPLRWTCAPGLRRCSEPAAAEAAARTARRALAAAAPPGVPELRWALGALRALRAPAPAADVGRGVEALRRLRAGAGKLRPAEGAPASVAATGLALQVLLRPAGDSLQSCRRRVPAVPAHAAVRQGSIPCNCMIVDTCSLDMRWELSMQVTAKTSPVPTKALEEPGPATVLPPSRLMSETAYI